MKVTLITVAYNSAKTIRKTLESIAAQDYPDIEHIVVDGASKDNTVEIVKEFQHVKKLISEPDKGMWDGLNKGLALAEGGIIGMLNSDDVYADNTIVSKVVAAFKAHQVDTIFGDIQFVSTKDPSKVVRYYSSKHFHPSKFRYGYMPAHPSFFVKREVYEKYGHFKADYKIAADYDLMIRFLKVHQVSYKYLDLMMVNMLIGGMSNDSLKSIYILNKEIVRTCRENGIYTNLLIVSLKYFRKVFELIQPGKKTVAHA
ncbi:MAG: glycosyltransferase [Cyanothece sp. SIO1E1]|nr:glycosyltransferase [Cyanothece sp. SIO1E1]